MNNQDLLVDECGGCTIKDICVKITQDIPYLNFETGNLQELLLKIVEKLKQLDNNEL